MVNTRTVILIAIIVLGTFIVFGGEKATAIISGRAKEFDTIKCSATIVNPVLKKSEITGVDCTKAPSITSECLAGIATVGTQALFRDDLTLSMLVNKELIASKTFSLFEAGDKKTVEMQANCITRQPAQQVEFVLREKTEGIVDTKEVIV